MDIIQLLKSDDGYNVRVTLGNAWLYWDETTNEWVVLKHKYRARIDTIIYRGDDEEEAVQALIAH